MHHPLRFIIPPLVMLAAVCATYVPMRRHAMALRTNPYHHPHPPVTHATAAGVVASALIVAFIAAFILP